MSDALPLESNTPFIPISDTTPVGEIKVKEPEIVAVPAEESRSWNVPVILAINVVGAVAYRYGNDPSLLPPEMLTMKWGPYFMPGSLRHLAVGSVITGVCEAGFALARQQHQKIKAFTVAQFPSVGYEFYQGFTLGHFGYGDIATAAATSGLHVAFSTRKRRKKT